MHNKSHNQPDNAHADRSVRDADTTSYSQRRDTQDSGSAPERPQEKLPHERDESARSTGNRLDETAPPSEGRISQARADAESGQRDTDRRGVPNDIRGTAK